MTPTCSAMFYQSMPLLKRTAMDLDRSIYSRCLLPAGHLTDHITQFADGEIREWPVRK